MLLFLPNQRRLPDTGFSLEFPDSPSTFYGLQMKGSSAHLRMAC